MKKAQFFYLLRRGFFAGGGGEWSTLVNAFKTRVLADGGTLESESCIRDDVKYLIQNPEPVAFTGLLNDYSGAAAAYSLRLLDNTYTGNAIKVRRASDNAEQDIAFANNELDTATLETFASGTDAFVTTWYDQSGNGVNATQTTASSQPKIVSSGSTILENGKAAVQFDGSNDVLRYEGDLVTDSVSSIFTSLNVGSFDSFKTFIDRYQSPDDGTASIRSRSTANTLEINSVTTTNASYRNSQLLISAFQSSGSSAAYIDGASVGTASSSANYDGISIGATRIRGSVFYSSPKMQEVILYNSNQSTNRTGIETNINDFYSIY